MSVFVNLRFFFLSISNFIVRLFNLAIWDPKRYHFPTYGLTQIIRYSSRFNSYRKHTVAISNSDYSMFMIMVFFVSMWNLYYMNILYIYMSCHVHPLFRISPILTHPSHFIFPNNIPSRFPISSIDTPSSQYSNFAERFVIYMYCEYKQTIFVYI